MPRPYSCRRVSGEPPSAFFKPRGIPIAALEVVTMTLDELEAIRLADLEGLHQEDAAQRMEISRPTFGRIIESAHKKIADALANGKALEIKGGEITMANQREFVCSNCQNRWQLPYGTGRPGACPQCRSSNIHRAPEDRGWVRREAGVQKAGPAVGMRRGRCRHRRVHWANLQGGLQ